ncbi:DUF2066 domain-containing protein [Reyranella sp.]|uniref:DUF2066 domain-containing protein n=1 Tax=Reyranella sp. TaxID=1929291 RepID=UPI003D13552C
MPSACKFSTILGIVLALFACTAQAQTASSGNTYSIGDIDVDVTGADAVQARQKGIREAQQQGIKRLVERMVPAEDRARVRPIDDARLDGLVRGTEFQRERTAGNRYIATLTVVYNAAAVRAWLNEANVSPTETVRRPALVIPLWKDGNGLEPLDDRNGWRVAWSGLDSSATAVPVTVVRGDQLDQNALSVEEAYVGDVSALARLNERYRVPTIIVAIVEGDKMGPLTISGVRYDMQTGAKADLPRITVPDASQLGDAARKMHARIDEEWRGLAGVRRDTQAALDVVVPIRALAEWVQVRQRLGAIPSIKTISVRSLEADRAELHLDYFGTPEQLQKTLGQAGLQLDKDADTWRLQVR